MNFRDPVARSALKFIKRIVDERRSVGGSIGGRGGGVLISVETKESGFKGWLGV